MRLNPSTNGIRVGFGLGFWLNNPRTPGAFFIVTHWIFFFQAGNRRLALTSCAGNSHPGGRAIDASSANHVRSTSTWL